MNCSRRKFLISAGAALGALTLSPWRGLSQPAPIRIGHQAPLSGFLAGFGLWHNRAIAAAIRLINESGGANGRRFELVTADATSDANTSVRVLEESLLDIENPVDFVIGSVLSESNIFSAPVAKEFKTPYFAQGVATPITGAAGNRYIFKSYHTAQGAIEGGWRWVLGNLGKRWTIIHSELAFARAQAQAWEEKLEEVTAEVVDVIPVPFDPASPPAFSQYLNLIDTSRTQGIFQAFSARDTIAFMQQASDLGLTRRFNTLGLIEGIDVLDVAAPAFENTYYITSYPRRADQVPAALQSFDQVYRSRVGIDGQGRALDNPAQTVPIADLFGSWQALHLIQSAITQIGWESPADHPALILALEGFQYESGQKFPQGNGFIRADDHQAFHGHYIERVTGGSLVVQAQSSLDESFYVPTVDYRNEPF